MLVFRKILMTSNKLWLDQVLTSLNEQNGIQTLKDLDGFQDLRLSAMLAPFIYMDLSDLKWSGSNEPSMNKHLYDKSKIKEQSFKRRTAELKLKLKFKELKTSFWKKTQSYD